ncbi:hypothetical protein BsWGS_10346 [Bradybaena similaris]
MQENPGRKQSSRIMQRNRIDLLDEIKLNSSEARSKKQQDSKTTSRRKRKTESSQDDESSPDIQESVSKLKYTKSEASQKPYSNDVSKSNKRASTQQKRSAKRNSEINQSANSLKPAKNETDLLQSKETKHDIDLLVKYKERLEDLKKYNVLSSVPIFEKLFRRYEGLRNDSKAAAMSKYMRNKFLYFGIATPERKSSIADLWTEVKTFSSSDLRTLAHQTWNSPEREFHYFTTELLHREIFRIYEDENLKTGDLALKTLDFVKLFIDHPSSWWDTVDGLAPNVVGPLVQKYPELLPEMDKWNKSSCFWVRRASIIYQLSFKKDTDADRLFRYCLQAADEEEFFIRKAIGWALRQYYRIDPEAVREFVLKHKNKLSPLSVKEALKHDQKTSIKCSQK